jgi:hypothetical protein
MPSVAFDEDLLRRMSDLVVAVNRRRHAEGHVDGDPGRLRVLAAEEERAEQAYVAALTMRGWRSPYALARGA